MHAELRMRDAGTQGRRERSILRRDAGAWDGVDACRITMTSSPLSFTLSSSQAYVSLVCPTFYSSPCNPVVSSHLFVCHSIITLHHHFTLYDYFCVVSCLLYTLYPLCLSSPHSILIPLLFYSHHVQALNSLRVLQADAREYGRERGTRWMAKKKKWNR